MSARYGSRTRSGEGVSNFGQRGGAGGVVRVKPPEVEYLIVAGGGGGGGGAYPYGGGGGGAGGVLTSTGGSPEPLAPGSSFTVTIGAGGVGEESPTVGSPGNNSVFASQTATGGGRGGGKANSVGQPGGSGGGNSSANPLLANAGSGTPGQGFDGGKNTSPYGSGGGGGWQEAGNTDANGQGGDGTTNGVSQSIPLFDTLVAFGGGGGGGKRNDPGSGAIGGEGGGGQGGISLPHPSPAVSKYGYPATANTGGGGGGGGQGGPNNNIPPFDTFGGNGGAGCIVIKYPTSYTLPLIGAGLTADQRTSPSEHIIIFTAGTDTISW